MNELIARLEAALPLLSERDQSFAHSLLSQAKSRGLSEKQLFWVKKLADNATQPAAAPAPAINASSIVTLFQTAGGKRARIVFEDDKGVGFRLTVAGGQSRFPGSINVTDTTGDFEGRVWFGRIHLDGTWERSRRADAVQAAQVEQALVTFAADPDGQSAAFGRRTGVCAFCNLQLTHEESIKLGRGPICSKRWGLPHSYSAPKCEAVAA